MPWSLLLFITLTLESFASFAHACESPLGCENEENPFYIPELDKDAVSQRAVQRPLGARPSSPLQASSTPTFPTVQEIQSLPACTLSCTLQFSETLQAALQAENHYDRYRQVCEKYNSTAACMSLLPDEQCKNKEAFFIMTSGLKYMCVEQRAAFNATIQCIDYHSDVVQKACDMDCNVAVRMGNFAVTLFRLQGVPAGGGGGGGDGGGLAALLAGAGIGGGDLDFIGAGQNAIDRMVTLRVAMKEGCEFSQCYLACIRKKFNVFCQGAAGELLAEAFIRPLADAQQNPMVMVMFYLIEKLPMPMLPKQCSFLVNPSMLQRLRIDPKVEQDLRRKYAEQQQQNGAAGNSTDIDAEEVDLDVILLEQMQQQADAEERARAANMDESRH